MTLYLKRFHFLSVMYFCGCYFSDVFGIFNSSFTSVASIHEVVVLDCSISENISITERTWKFGRKSLFTGQFPVNPGSSQMSIDRNYSLIVTNVSFCNVGIYICSDQNSTVIVEHLLKIYGKHVDLHI